ncbi:sensor histidine kinase [Mycolicibacterium austroafricanum]|uniref:sensor histidine kinase n=1 Tax=Mycolicibacterium austroafricanum TaxID=39687 RepID=UPI001CA342E8|nr:sensor histidine kinase [Mycolicibacterium austroafricanum]QZT61485.1 sensor histidine kinase [Mycolicibacterium austroafricanum]
MTAVTHADAATDRVPVSSHDHAGAAPPRPRTLSVAASASLLVGGAIASVWFWVPLGILVIGVSSIPSVIGFLLAGVVFIYLIRGVDHVERVRSEAVFGMGIPVPPRARSPYTGFQRWAHQLWLDLSSARFWKTVAHHYLRMVFDALVTGLAFALTVFAFLAPAAAIAIGHSDPEAGLSFLPTPVAWLLALVALAAAAALVAFAPTLDAMIDRWLLPPSSTAELQHQVTALADARQGAVTSAQTERHRIERDLHDSVQPRLVSLAMTIGLAQTKLDSDLPAAKALIAEAHDDAKNALVELRNVVRGIAPTILSDRGLDAALSSVVQRSANAGVPTTLSVHLPHRLPDEVEACAYFVVAEALTNVSRHSGASHAAVTVRLDESANQLHVSVFDDGRGGARIVEADGNMEATGLRGLDERVRAAQGTFSVSSPVTGPTIVTAVLPCGS